MEAEGNGLVDRVEMEGVTEDGRRAVNLGPIGECRVLCLMRGHV